MSTHSLTRSLSYRCTRPGLFALAECALRQLMALLPPGHLAPAMSIHLCGGQRAVPVSPVVGNILPGFAVPVAHASAGAWPLQVHSHRRPSRALPPPNGAHSTPGFDGNYCLIVHAVRSWAYSRPPLLQWHRRSANRINTCHSLQVHST